MVLPCSKFETLLHNYPSRRVAISLGSGSGIRVAFTEAQRSISEEIYEKMSTELKLKASDVAGVQEFGSAVAVSRDYTIAGARHDGFDPGAAYVFEKNGAVWVEQAKLSASDTTGFDHFGAAVGIDDDYAIIGASQGGIGSRGQAYIFHRNGSDWVEDTILFANGETDDALFGQSVSISGDWAIVGSDKAAYMFQRTGSTWTGKAKLTPDEASDFGRSVSINGNYAVVGATNINQSPAAQHTSFS